MAQTLDSMISVGVTGMTSRCSMVPCSRSRISRAGQDDGQHGDVVDDLVQAPNQLSQRRVEARAHGQLHRRGRADALALDELVHLGQHDLLHIAAAGEGLAHARGVDVELQLRRAQPARWKPWGRCREKVYRPASMPGRPRSWRRAAAQ
jgi:hypothetical protein